jgi:hypothetical protein
MSKKDFCGCRVTRDSDGQLMWLVRFENDGFVCHNTGDEETKMFIAGEELPETWYDLDEITFFVDPMDPLTSMMSKLLDFFSNDSPSSLHYIKKSMIYDDGTSEMLECGFKVVYQGDLWKIKAERVLVND